MNGIGTQTLSWRECPDETRTPAKIALRCRATSTIGSAGATVAAGRNHGDGVENLNTEGLLRASNTEMARLALTELAGAKSVLLVPRTVRPDEEPGRPVAAGERCLAGVLLPCLVPALTVARETSRRSACVLDVGHAAFIGMFCLRPRVGRLWCDGLTAAPPFGWSATTPLPAIASRLLAPVIEPRVFESTT